jgi:uncharacterized protein YeaO (DUF488 family)
MRFSLKRAYEPPDERDGARVLVDRLWPRGLARSGARIDHWAKDAAPSAELRRWFAHRPERWTAFAARYRAELDGAAARAEVARLRELARSGPVTLLYAARDPAMNNAVVLRDYLRAVGERA